MERTIYPCKEFEAIEVPLDCLIVGGQVSVYPEAASRGFFDIDYRSGKLVLTAKNYIGLIPINDRIAIHVVPRFPIENLLHILQKADQRIRFVSGHVRTYSSSINTIDNPGALFGAKLLEQLQHIQRGGLLRRYVSQTTHGSLQGDLQLTPTITQYFSQGVRYKHVRNITSLSSNLPENRLIKSALSKLAAYYSQRTDKQSCEFAGEAKSLLTLFDRVPEKEAHRQSLYFELPSFVHRLPNTQQYYASLLWLAYLIEERKGLLIEKVGPITFDTLVVNLAELFESYLRNLMRENINKIYPGARVEDGNKRQVKLFAQGQPNPVKPDIYVTLDRKTILIMDAKYKPKISEEDRYAMLAYCDALQFNKAILVSPSLAGEEGITLLGKTRSGIELYHAKLNIGSINIQDAEQRFISEIQAVA